MKKLLLLLLIVCCSEQLFTAYTIEFRNKTANLVDVKVRQKCFPAQDFTFTLWPRGTIIGTDLAESEQQLVKTSFTLLAPTGTLSTPIMRRTQMPMALLLRVKKLSQERFLTAKKLKRILPTLV